MLNLLVATQDSIPQFKSFVDNWETHNRLATKRKQEANAFTTRKTFNVWELVDKSLPIIINNERLVNGVPIDGEVWFVRLMHHKDKGLCLDVRKFKKVDKEGLTSTYEPTNEGIVLPKKEWSKLLDPLFKLLKKHKENI